MSTTSLKLTNELKQRAASAAHKLGVSLHAFMIGAVEKAASDAEKRQEFVAEALAAKEQLLTDGHGFAAGDVHAWLQARASGKKSTRPQAKSWRS